MSNYKKSKGIISLFLMLLIISSCYVPRKLNVEIDKSQKLSLKDSPFETAEGMTTELKIQKKYRHYENDLATLIKTYPNDTIILVENYDFICLGCPADFVQIFRKNELISYERNFDVKKYEKTIEQLSEMLFDTTGFFHRDIYELRAEIKKGYQWNDKPEKYGTDDCLDGGNTFYTVFYPTGNIESMYMRCWVPKEFRDNK